MIEKVRLLYNELHNYNRVTIRREKVIYKVYRKYPITKKLYTVLQEGQQTQSIQKTRKW